LTASWLENSSEQAHIYAHTDGQTTQKHNARMGRRLKTSQYSSSAYQNSKMLNKFFTTEMISQKLTGILSLEQQMLRHHFTLCSEAQSLCMGHQGVFHK